MSSPAPLPQDIYTEPAEVDAHTLRNLGPLTRMAGIWQGPRGLDVKPKAEGPKIPRGQTAMAVGQAAADAKSFELVATRGLETFGICSVPFLEYAFKTVEFRIKVTLNDDGTWSYDEDTVLMIRGRDEPFHHTDCNTLTKIAEPTPNPLAR